MRACANPSVRCRMVAEQHRSPQSPTVPSPRGSQSFEKPSGSLTARVARSPQTFTVRMLRNPQSLTTSTRQNPPSPEVCMRRSPQSFTCPTRTLPPVDSGKPCLPMTPRWSANQCTPRPFRPALDRPAQRDAKLVRLCGQGADERGIRVRLQALAAPRTRIARGMVHCLSSGCMSQCSLSSRHSVA